jgi:hypothetical protein
MKSVSYSDLVAMRDELIRLLDGEPGFRSVGIAKDNGKTVLGVSADTDEFHKAAPRTFHGMGVKVRDLGTPMAQ